MSDAVMKYDSLLGVESNPNDVSDVPDDLPEEPATGCLTRQIRVPARLAGERADRVAAELLPEFSRARLTRWLKEGALTFDGAAPAPKKRLDGGELLRLDAVVSEDRSIVPQDVPFEVCYEDAHLLVIDKPAGLVVHPGAGNRDQTLVNGLIAHRPALAVLPRAGLIHRLDKGTTGLLIAAATEQSFQILTRALAERRITRRYQAVVEGEMTGGREIEAPIGRDARHRTRQRVADDGRYALTRVRLAERFRRHARIEAELATGRTHQIRVHLSSVGHPLVGDTTYGSRGLLPRGAAPELIEQLRGFGRPALHAWQLELEHPVSGANLALEATLPEDFRTLVETLRQDAAADHRA